VAIAGFAEFVNLTYHSEWLHFAMKWLKFDYFYLVLASFCQWMEIIGSFHRKNRRGKTFLPARTSFSTI